MGRRRRWHHLGGASPLLLAAAASCVAGLGQLKPPGWGLPMPCLLGAAGLRGGAANLQAREASIVPRFYDKADPPKDRDSAQVAESSRRTTPCGAFWSPPQAGASCVIKPLYIFFIPNRCSLSSTIFGYQSMFSLSSANQVSPLMATPPGTACSAACPPSRLPASQQHHAVPAGCPSAVEGIIQCCVLKHTRLDHGWVAPWRLHWAE